MSKVIRVLLSFPGFIYSHKLQVQPEWHYNSLVRASSILLGNYFTPSPLFKCPSCSSLSLNSFTEAGRRELPQTAPHRRLLSALPTARTCMLSLHTPRLCSATGDGPSRRAPCTLVYSRTSLWQLCPHYCILKAAFLV